MGGPAATLREWDAQYFPVGEPVSADEPIPGYAEQEDRLFADHSRMRRIVLRLLPDWPLHRY